MNWQKHIQDLKENKDITIKPRGHSMSPKIDHKNKVTISPDTSNIKKGDIVFCKVKNNHYIHLVTATNKDKYQISNNKGRINGWIGKKCIFGKVIKIEK